MTIAKVGIDASINSTGLSIILQDNTILFYQICNEQKKCSPSVQFKLYKRIINKDSYTKDDLTKVISAGNLSKKIKEILNEVSKLYNIDKFDCRQEGSIMSSGFKNSQSRVNDLVVFNTEIKRMLLTFDKTKHITILAPSTLKKSYTGKGNAKKERMIEVFLEEFPEFINIGKIDDVVDAYALAKYEANHEKESLNKAE